MAIGKNRIRIRISGRENERFLNICRANDVQYENVMFHSLDGQKCVELDLSPSDFKKIKGMVKKTRSKACILSKQGPLFVAYRYRKRNCFCIGMFGAVLLIYILSLFLWNIKVQGNCSISYSEIVACLKNHGVQTGCFMKSISCSELEKVLRNEFDEMTWVSLESKGTSLNIYVKENDEDIVLARDMEPCDIVATKSGIVNAIVTRTGTPQVKVGEFVEEGNVLVRGVVDVFDDYGVSIGEETVPADADVQLMVQYPYSGSVDKWYQYKIYTGTVKKQYYFQVFNKIIKFGFPKKIGNNDKVFYDKQVKMGDNYVLPLHVGQITGNEYYLENAEYSLEEAKVILMERFDYFIDNLTEKGVQILEKNVTIESNVEDYTCEGTVKVLEQAVCKQYYINETEQDGVMNERN